MGFISTALVALTATAITGGIAHATPSAPPPAVIRAIGDPAPSHVAVAPKATVIPRMPVAQAQHIGLVTTPVGVLAGAVLGGAVGAVVGTLVGAIFLVVGAIPGIFIGGLAGAALGAIAGGIVTFFVL